MNPYKILGIEKEATDAEVKKAYRELSKIHHPDVGGGEKLFQEINLAYRTLSDHAKRKLYDEEGIVDDDIDNTENIINTRLATMAEQWLNNMVKGQKIPLKPFTINILDSNIRQAHAANREMKEVIRVGTDILKRLAHKDGESIVHGVIKTRIQKCKQGIKHNNEEIEIVEQMKAAIEEYEYEEVEALLLNTGGTTSTVFNGMGGIRFG